MRGIARSASKIFLVLVFLVAAELAAARYDRPVSVTVGEHPTRFWALTPNTALQEAGATFIIRVNSLGLRGGEPDLSSAGPRMLVLGDSCIFGVALPNDATLDRFLEGELRAATGEPWQVLNAGVPGYTSFQGLDFLEEVAPKVRPDVVLVCFRCNDMALGQEPDHRRLAGWPISELRRVLWKSSFYRVLRAHMLGFRPGLPPPPVMIQPGEIPRVPIDRFRDNLKQIARVSRDSGATSVVYLRLPDRIKVEPPPGAPDYGREILAAGAENGVPVDAAGPWKDLHLDPDTVFLPGDPYHFTRRGNQELARILVRLMLENPSAGVGQPALPVVQQEGPPTSGRPGTSS